MSQQVLHVRTASPNVSYMPVKPTARHNGAAIRGIRVSQGRTCREVAERVGIHEQTLRNLELYDSTNQPADADRRRRVGVELAYRIARELSVPINAILIDPVGHEQAEPEEVAS